MTCWEKLDLRFAHEQEQEFKQSLERTLLHRGSILCFLEAILSLWQAEQLLQSEARRIDNPLTSFSSGDPRIAIMIKLALNVFMSLVLLFSMRLHLCYGCLRCNWERVVLVWSIWLVAANALLPARAAIMFDGGSAAFGYDTSLDAETELLLLSCILAAFTVYLPVRSCCTWLPACTGVLVSMLMDWRFPVTSAGGRGDDYALVFCLIYSLLHAAFGNETTSRERWLATGRVAEQEGYLASRHAAACSLLATLCDTWVQLGPELEIVEQSPQLSALLFRSERELAGCKITDLLPSDEQNFMDAVKTMDSSRSKILPLHFKDVNGKQVATHAYFTRFDNCKESGFLMGIVENQEATEPASVTECVLPSIISRSPDPSRQVSTATSDTSGGEVLSNIDDDIRVKVALLEGLPILGYSTAFASIFGPLIDNYPLTSVLRDTAAPDFARWLGQSVLEHFVQLPAYSGLKLHPPSVAFQDMYLAVGATSFVSLGEDTSGGTLMAELRLEGVHKKKRGRKVPSALGPNMQSPSVIGLTRL